MSTEEHKSSLADKLKALGVKVGTDLTPPKPVSVQPIEEVVPGEYHQTSHGEAFAAEECYPADYLHGRFALKSEVPLDMLAAWARDSRLISAPPEAFAYLDTETSGLAGGTGTYAFMVGVGRFEGETFRLAQFFMRDPAEEPAMLEALAKFLAPTSILVTYNGKAFDAPLLITRYTLHDIPVPFQEYSHVDLLPLARRLWRDRLPSRTLKYIEEHVMRAPRSSEEVPGYEIPYLYFDYLRTGDAEPLKGVFYHNEMDILALAALLGYTSELLADPLGGKVEHALDMVAIAKLYEDLGQWDRAARIYEQGLEADLEEPDFWEATRRLSILQKRRGDLEEAVRWWQQAAEKGHIYAHVELAKYYEHCIKDFAEALKWTEAALAQTRKSGLPEYMHRHWQKELEHRQKRLIRRA
ncbi:MAG: ribonuclease H-like domain-containing protein [Anaerolineales bacterium]|nr:ribonuclease H-like domain-containing protein [Anaerolineales bacterium]